MDHPVPKQFLPLLGKPLLLYSLEAFVNYDPDMEIVLVLPPDALDRWDEICREFAFSHPVKTASGGRTRFHSVSSGLSSLAFEESTVAVHDAVRPFISRDLLDRLFTAAEQEGSAVPVYPIQESLRENDGEKLVAVDRKNYATVQTPQCFRYELLKTSYLQTYRDTFTDDATVYEYAGGTIFTVPGEKWNIKITEPEDLLVAEFLAGNVLRKTV